MAKITIKEIIKKIDQRSDLTLLLTIIAFLFICIPLIIISFYAHPSADDFCFAVKVRDLGFWGAQNDWYFAWTGRFFSSFTLSAVSSSINLASHYKFIPLAILASLFLAFILFTDQIFQKQFPLKTRIAAGISFFILYVISMPSLVEGIYWMSGAITYTLSAILILLFFSLLIYSLRAKTIITKFVAVLPLSALAAAAIGSNETAMIALLATITGITIGYFIQKLKQKWFMLLILGVTLIASLFVIGAPGNAVRAIANPHGYGVISSMIWAVLNTLKIVSENIGSSELWLFTLLYLPMGNIISDKLKSRHKIFNSNPVWPAVTLLILLSVITFPTFFKLGSAPPFRMSDLLEFIFLAGWFFCIQATINYFPKTGLRNLKLKNSALIIILAVITITTILGKTEIKNTYFSILNKTAAKYDQEMIMRDKTISAASTGTVSLNRIENKPSTIFFSDLKVDPGLDKCYADYFHVNKVELKAPIPQTF